jgi:hypothetical protein
MRFTLSFAAMAVALLLAACQTGGQKNPPATGAATGGPAPGAPATRNSAERNAVAAFSRICGLLNRDTVAQRAAQFGFVPARNDAMPAELRSSLEKSNGLMFVRPAGAPAMLVWSEPQICELWVGGVEIAGVEQEFGQFIGRIADGSNARSSVTRFSPEDAARMRSSDGSQLRQGAFIAPRDLVATPPRVMALRSPATSAVFQAQMIHRVATPSPGAPPATTARSGPAKDPVR